MLSTKGDLFTVNMAEAEEDYDLLCLRCRRGYGDWEHFRRWRYAHRGFHDREMAEAAGNLVIFENFDPRG